MTYEQIECKYEEKCWRDVRSIYSQQKICELESVNKIICHFAIIKDNSNSVAIAHAIRAETEADAIIIIIHNRRTSSSTSSSTLIPRSRASCNVLEVD